MSIKLLDSPNQIFPESLDCKDLQRLDTSFLTFINNLSFILAKQLTQVSYQQVYKSRIIFLIYTNFFLCLRGAQTALDFHMNRPGQAQDQNGNESMTEWDGKTSGRAAVAAENGKCKSGDTCSPSRPFLHSFLFPLLAVFASLINA